MVGNMKTPNVVKGNNKAAAVNKSGKAKPVVEHENNHGNTKFTDTELKSNNILGANIVEEKEGRLFGWADRYDEWNNYFYTPTEENEPGISHTFMGDNSILKLTKTEHNRRTKTRLVSEVPTSIRWDFYISECQK